MWLHGSHGNISMIYTDVPSLQFNLCETLTQQNYSEEREREKEPYNTDYCDTTTIICHSNQPQFTK